MNRIISQVKLLMPRSKLVTSLLARSFCEMDAEIRAVAGVYHHCPRRAADHVTSLETRVRQLDDALAARLHGAKFFSTGMDSPVRRRLGDEKVFG